VALTIHRSLGPRLKVKRNCTSLHPLWDFVACYKENFTVYLKERNRHTHARAHAHTDRKYNLGLEIVVLYRVTL